MTSDDTLLDGPDESDPAEYAAYWAHLERALGPTPQEKAESERMAEYAQQIAEAEYRREGGY